MNRQEVNYAGHLHRNHSTDKLLDHYYEPSLVNQGDYEVLRLSAFPQLPFEICHQVWGYLNRNDLVAASRVSRLWKNFTQPFMLNELSKVRETTIFEYLTKRKGGSYATFNQQKEVTFSTTKKSRSTKSVVFDLRAVNVPGMDYADWSEEVKKTVEDSNVVVFTFHKGKNFQRIFE